ncbi:SMC-Scp complex subunit ScpB [Rhodopseudomonas sp. B29]|uniref:SMC-Scp complex subunit ScpB n=1 Tax=Rhodopseudomonas sp. B29 TaxID=95607 RepID=UPI00034AE8D1|nr:SMC-Scp complex subunit ScpB [Rhodopseudomonas sp. B29]
MASLAEKRIVQFDEEFEHDDVSTEQQPQARPEELRLLEALLFASPEPLDQAALAKRMPEGVDVKVALKQLQDDYAHRGVNLVRVANKWTFRTAGDLAWLMTRETTETKKLSRAAIEMLAIIAYHQPITRAEIEEIRGVVTSKGTLDVLLETGWIKPRGRRKTPGRPLTFGTTDAFLSQFNLEALNDLPGLDELKGAGLLDTRLPTGFSVPTPSDDPALREDEDPLEPGDIDLALAPQADPETEAEAAASDAEQTTEAEVQAASVGTIEAGESEAAAHEVSDVEVGFVETVEAEFVEADVSEAEFAEPEAETEAAGTDFAEADESDNEIEAEEEPADDVVAEQDEPEQASAAEVEAELSEPEAAELPDAGDAESAEAADEEPSPDERDRE